MLEFFCQIASPSVELLNNNKFAMDAVGGWYNCLSIISVSLWCDKPVA